MGTCRHGLRTQAVVFLSLVVSSLFVLPVPGPPRPHGWRSTVLGREGAVPAGGVGGAWESKALRVELCVVPESSTALETFICEDRLR